MTCTAGQGSALGDLLAGLVDGELDHATRERAQTHLLHCDDCRAEVDAQRRLKARLSGLAPAVPSTDLTARLLALTVPGTEPGRVPIPIGAVRPAGIRTTARPGGTSGPASARGTSGPTAPGVRRTTRPRARRATMGSALAVLGVGVLIALGGPRGGGGVTPVDPGGDGFVVDYVNRTTEVTVEPAGFTAGDLVP